VRLRLRRGLREADLVEWFPNFIGIRLPAEEGRIVPPIFFATVPAEIVERAR
jgi:hypothetical protein